MNTVDFSNDAPETSGDALGGDTFEGWFNAYFERLCRASQRVLGDRAAAEDVAQEVLCRAWEHRQRFEDPEHAAAWLFRVARNLSVDVLRGRKRLVPADPLPDAPDPGQDPASHVLHTEEHQAVREAFRGLSAKEREVLYLREVERARYDVVASRFGLTAAGARTMLFRARRTLREAVAEKGALGVLVFPVYALRRAWVAMWNGAVKWGSRPVPGYEVAALATAMTIAAGSLTMAPREGHGELVEEPPSSSVPSSAVVERPRGSSSGSGAHGPQEAAQAPRGGSSSESGAEETGVGWRAGLTIGGRSGDPDSGTELGVEVPERVAEHTGVDRAPCVEASVLERPPEDTDTSTLVDVLRGSDDADDAPPLSVSRGSDDADDVPLLGISYTSEGDATGDDVGEDEAARAEECRRAVEIELNRRF